MSQKLKIVIKDYRQSILTTMLAVLVMAGTWSCTNNNEIKPIVDNNRPMRWGAFAVNGLSGTKVTETTLANLDSIAVYGYYTRTKRWWWETLNEPDSLFANRFCNVKLKKNNSWTYNPIQYWPIDSRNKISFFAYAPAMDMIALNGNLAPFIPAPLSDTIAMRPQITIAVDAVIQKQVDLLYATALDRSWEDNNGVVDFQMKHALAGIRFSAELGANELAKGYCVRILSIGLFNVHGRGIMHLDDGQWTYLDTSSDINGNSTMFGNYILSIDKGRLINEDLTGRGGNFANPGIAPPHVWALEASSVGFLKVLPQTIEDNEHAMVAIELEFTQSGVADPLIMPFPVLLNQIYDTTGTYVPAWEAGKVIDYRFIITDEFITVRTRSIGWNDMPQSNGVVLL